MEMINSKKQHKIVLKQVRLTFLLINYMNHLSNCLFISGALYSWLLLFCPFLLLNPNCPLFSMYSIKYLYPILKILLTNSMQPNPNPTQPTPSSIHQTPPPTQHPQQHIGYSQTTSHTPSHAPINNTITIDNVPQQAHKDTTHGLMRGRNVDVIDLDDGEICDVQDLRQLGRNISKSQQVKGQAIPLPCSNALPQVLNHIQLTQNQTVTITQINNQVETTITRIEQTSITTNINTIPPQYGQTVTTTVQPAQVIELSESSTPVFHAQSNIQIQSTEPIQQTVSVQNQPLAQGPSQQQIQTNPQNVDILEQMIRRTTTNAQFHHNDSEMVDVGDIAPNHQISHQMQQQNRNDVAQQHIEQAQHVGQPPIQAQDQSNFFESRQQNQVVSAVNQIQVETIDNEKVVQHINVVDLDQAKDHQQIQPAFSSNAENVSSLKQQPMQMNHQPSQQVHLTPIQQEVNNQTQNQEQPPLSHQQPAVSQAQPQIPVENNSSQQHIVLGAVNEPQQNLVENKKPDDGLNNQVSGPPVEQQQKQGQANLQDNQLIFSTQSPDLTDINEIRELLLRSFPPNLRELTLSLDDEQLKQMYLEIRAQQMKAASANNANNQQSQQQKPQQKNTTPIKQSGQPQKKKQSPKQSQPQKKPTTGPASNTIHIEESKEMTEPAPKRARKQKKRVVTTVVQQVEYFDQSEGEGQPSKYQMQENGELKKKRANGNGNVGNANNKAHMQSILGQLCGLIKSLDLSSFSQNS